MIDLMTAAQKRLMHPPYTVSGCILKNQKEYGVSSSALSGWIRKYSQVQLDDDTVLTAQQVKALQRRNAELEAEHLILKKAIAIFTPHSGSD